MSGQLEMIEVIFSRKGKPSKEEIETVINPNSGHYRLLDVVESEYKNGRTETKVRLVRA